MRNLQQRGTIGTVLGRPGTIYATDPLRFHVARIAPVGAVLSDMQTSRRLMAALLLAAVPGLLYAYSVRIHALLPETAVGARIAPLGGVVARDTLPGIAD